MIGEIGAAIGQIFIFGFMQGSQQLIFMWIDYMAYASMHYCQVLMVSFISALDTIMLFMRLWDGGQFEALIYESSITLLIYWILVTFAIVKTYSAFHIYN